MCLEGGLEFWLFNFGLEEEAIYLLVPVGEVQSAANNIPPPSSPKARSRSRTISAGTRESPAITAALTDFKLNIIAR